MNKEKVSQYSKKAFIKHKDKIYLRSKISRQELKDYIVKKYLRAAGFSFEEITPELIELKRQQIILQRLLKQKQMNATVNGFNYRSDYVFDHVNKEITIKIFKGRQVVSELKTSLDLSITQLELKAMDMLIEYLGQQKLF